MTEKKTGIIITVTPQMPVLITHTTAAIDHAAVSIAHVVAITIQEETEIAHVHPFELPAIWKKVEALQCDTSHPFLTHLV